jgi:hypothetical protein
LADLASGLVFGAVLALGLAPLEYTRYREFLDLPGPAVRVTVALIIVGKTLALMLPGVLGAVVLHRLRWRRATVALAAGSSLVVVVWLWLDLLVHEVTGNHGTFYLGFLGEPDTWQWAGTPRLVWTLFQARARELGFLALGALALAIGAALLVRRAVTGSAGVLALTMLWIVLLGAGPVMARFLGMPFTFVQLDETLPMSWNLGFGAQVSGLAEAQTRATALYTTRFIPKRAAVDPLPAGAPRQRPTILIAVVDGLRADAFNPTVMPRLWRWSARGTRFARHYANSNMSSGGMLALAAGRYPLEYPEEGTRLDLDLPRLLKEAGYDNHFFTSSSLTWGGLQRFLGPPSFTMHEDAQEGTTHERDARNVAKAREILASGDQPRFLLLFLMSTHFLYSYPSRYDGFSPDLAELLPSVDAKGADGATHLLRSVRYMDDLVGEWLEGIDLDRTLVIVTGDHGESFNDDGTFFHGSRLSDVQTHVAFVLAGPGVPAGKVETSLTEHVDVAPTILASLGYPPAARGRLHGRVLLDEDGPGFATVVFRAGRFENPRVLAFLSPDLRFSLRLAWKEPQVELLGKLDPQGLPLPGDLTPDERTTFVSWFENFVGRAGR